MIHDILKILDTTDLQELDKQRITTDLLRLQREQLKAFADYVQSKMWEHEGKDLSGFVDEFISR